MWCTIWDWYPVGGLCWEVSFWPWASLPCTLLECWLCVWMPLLLGIGIILFFLLLVLLCLLFVRGYVITSFVIAWMAASSSLYIVSFCYLLWQQFMAALLMSLAVTGMHFVGIILAKPLFLICYLLSIFCFFDSKRNGIGYLYLHRRIRTIRITCIKWQLCIHYFHYVYCYKFHLFWTGLWKYI